MSVVQPGDVLADKYRVDRILAIGGMGMVVAATHLELDQRVALKFMLPDALLSPTAADRFLREARAAVKLRGEHVCRVLDVGKLATGAPYIVMEYLEGEDFAHVIARAGALPVPVAVDHILQALEGLAEAHVAAIVHRDLKPQNLYMTLDSDGSPLIKVLDFGISKSAGGGATKTGDVMGTPSYMAPEQMVSAKDVDARADLWAIGVILYHATSGRLPFDGDNIPALCMAVMTAAPPPLAVVAPHVPPGFATVVMRCLEKSRENRPADVGELAAALAPFGTPDAVASAARIAKVLRRVGAASSSSAIPAIPAPSYPPVATALEYAARTPSAREPINTIAAGAGESIPARPAARTGRRRWVIVPGAVAVAIALVAFTSTRGSSGESRDAIGTPATAPTEPKVDPKPADPKPADPNPADPKPVEPNPVDSTANMPVQTDPTPNRRANDPSPTSRPSPKPVRARDPNTPNARPLAKSAGSGSNTTDVVEAPKPGSGSASSGTSYRGTKGKIITEYPPSSDPPSAPK